MGWRREWNSQASRPWHCSTGGQPGPEGWTQETSSCVLQVSYRRGQHKPNRAVCTLLSLPCPWGAEIMGGNLGKWPGEGACLGMWPEEKHWPEPCLLCQSLGCKLVSLNPSKADWQPSVGATSNFRPTSCWE